MFLTWRKNTISSIIILAVGTCLTACSAEKYYLGSTVSEEQQDDNYRRFKEIQLKDYLMDTFKEDIADVSIHMEEDNGDITEVNLFITAKEALISQEKKEMIENAVMNCLPDDYDEDDVCIIYADEAE